MLQEHPGGTLLVPLSGLGETSLRLDVGGPSRAGDSRKVRGPGTVHVLGVCPDRIPVSPRLKVRVSTGSSV